MLMRKRAWDIMREDFPKVTEDATLAEVVKVMNTSIKKDPESNFVLVFSAKGKFLGGISMWNILQGMGPCLLKKIPLRKDIDWDETFHDACRACSQKSGCSVIQRDIPVIKPTEPLARIMEIFIDYRNGRAVVEEGGKIIGMVLLSDLYREISEDVSRW